MEIIREDNLEKAKARIKKSKKPIVIDAIDEKYNRKILEYGNFQVLLSPEKNTGLNKIKQNDSGFNHVLAKIAAKNKISIGIDLKEISQLSKKEKAERLAKIRQNIKICRKAKARIKVINSKNPKIIQSFLISLGASTQQAREAITF